MVTLPCPNPLPTIQSLVAYSMQKMRGRVWFVYRVNEANVYVGRRRGEAPHGKNALFVLNKVFSSLKHSELQRLDRYRIAGNFRWVQFFAIFADRPASVKIKTAKKWTKMEIDDIITCVRRVPM